MSSVPPSDQMRVSGSGRRKVALPPGRSQLDWVRNQARLTVSAPKTVTMKELRSHRSRTDAWMAINGKVFNVTPYIEYHPGGIEMIMAGAGKDATKLFEKYHPWVNPHFMLSRCYIGVLDAREDDNSEDSSSTEEETVDEHPESDQPKKAEIKEKPDDSSRPELEVQSDALEALQLQE